MVAYSETKVDVTRKHHTNWLIPQENAGSHAPYNGTVALVSL
jgi:hypothetical protein